MSALLFHHFEINDFHLFLLGLIFYFLIATKLWLIFVALWKRFYLWNLKFGIWNLEFGTWNLKFEIWDFETWNLELRVSNFFHLKKIVYLSLIISKNFSLKITPEKKKKKKFLKLISFIFEILKKNSLILHDFSFSERRKKKEIFFWELTKLTQQLRL